MRQRRRKLIGTTLLVVIVPLYALIIAAAASRVLSDASSLVQTIFFLVTGLVWVLPAAVVIKWMLRPDDLAPD